MKIDLIVHKKKRILDGLEDNEFLIVQKINETKLKVTFVNEGSLIEKHFGKDEIETIYEIIGEKVSKFWWKLFFKKIKMDKSTDFKEVEKMCEDLDLFHHRLIW